MKPLIAIVSCAAHKLYREAIRRTWLPTVPEGVDVLFFMGSGSVSEHPDEIVLEAARDDYEGLPCKIKEIVRWAYTRGYSHVLKCDNDVILKVKELLASGFEKYDFVGGAEPACKAGEIQTPFGFCYWLSRRAMELIIAAPIPGETGSTHAHNHGNDEAWVSTVLYLNGIYLHGDLRYFLHRGTPLYRKPTLGHPRALRRDKDRPPLPTPVADTFAWCIYLNMNGWHQTPVEEILEEFYRIWNSVK